MEYDEIYAKVLYSLHSLPDSPYARAREAIDRQTIQNYTATSWPKGFEANSHAAFRRFRR